MRKRRYVPRRCVVATRPSIWQEHNCTKHSLWRDGGKKYKGMEVDANDEGEDMLKKLATGKSGSVVFRRQMS